MKQTVKCVLIFIITFIAVTANAQKKRTKADALEITGIALLNDQKVSNYGISMYLDGTKIDSMFTKSKKTITFYVAYNQVYTFLFQKENCKDKIVIVNTHLPQGLKSMQDDTFDFEIEMSESLSKNNKELEDYPVAVLYIDKKQEMLQASADYNKFTHSNENVITTDISKKKSKNK